VALRVLRALLFQILLRHWRTASRTLFRTCLLHPALEALVSFFPFFSYSGFLRMLLARKILVERLSATSQTRLLATHWALQQRWSAILECNTHWAIRGRARTQISNLGNRLLKAAGLQSVYEVKGEQTFKFMICNRHAALRARHLHRAHFKPRLCVPLHTSLAIPAMIATEAECLALANIIIANCAGFGACVCGHFIHLLPLVCRGTCAITSTGSSCNLCVKVFNGRSWTF
jgi:hypothetical protein